MNPLFVPTLLLALALFVVGKTISQHTNSLWFVIGCLLAGVPGIAFAAYYTGVFGEEKWFYVFRSLAFTELAAAGVGLLAGWLQHKRELNPRVKRRMSAFSIPFLMVLCVSAPYLKQIFLRPDWNQFENQWKGDVCLQSSESSCGPAAAATLLHHFGIDASELEIAQASFTTRRGTENWYLLRTIHQHGLDLHYAVVSPGLENILVPSIAGVRLNLAQNTGHFITVLARDGEKFVVGDPLNGREVLSREELQDRYVFTGFYLVHTASGEPK